MLNCGNMHLGDGLFLLGIDMHVILTMIQSVGLWMRHVHVCGTRSTLSRFDAPKPPLLT